MYRPEILFLTSSLSSFVEEDLRMLQENYPVREVITGGGPAGSLVQVDRIEFERIGGIVRWNLFAGGRRIYSATDRPGNLAGWLPCSNVLLRD